MLSLLKDWYQRRAWFMEKKNQLIELFLHQTMYIPGDRGFKGRPYQQSS